MTTTTTTTTRKNDASVIIEGPDLNESRSPLDKKLYRQILLPNGLRAVLISDTLAMHQDFFYDDDDDDDEEEDDDDEEMKEEKSSGKARKNDKDEDDDDDDEGADDEDDDESGAGGDDGLRDAAAAMVVGVGSMYDPPEAQGLAHFLEHMLFMGTAKYPEENAYEAFLSKHGGSDNAYTEIEYTVYHLSIPQEKLFPALDMFAQFFINPLMKEDSVERELNSIESEFQLSKNSDQCRLQQLMCHTAGDTKLPFTKFAWGNLESLKETPEKHGVNVMQVLRQFYDQYYFAQNMRLVVIGGYSLDELQKQVESRFSDISPEPREEAPFKIQYKNTSDAWEKSFETVMSQNPLPLQPSSLTKIYRLVPVRDRHSLSITWQVPPQVHHWRSKPCDYLAHLLGHEAKGSLLSALKRKSWVTECYAGVGTDGVEFASSHALFAVSFSLSEEGMNHWEEIIQQVFCYIGMLRYLCDNAQLPEWIHEELRLTHDVGYRYCDEENPEEFVERIADRLAPHFQCPADRLLDGRDLLFDYDEGLIKDLLDNSFTASNIRVDIMSSQFGREGDFGMDAEDEGKKDEEVSPPAPAHVVVDGPFDPKTAGKPLEEPFFGTHYWCNDISESTIKAWAAAAEPQMPPSESMLSLPPKNPYVPARLDLKPLPPDDSDHPLLNSSLKLCVSVGKRKVSLFKCCLRLNKLNFAFLTELYMFSL
jgi:nardilysin